MARFNSRKIYRMNNGGASLVNEIVSVDVVKGHDTGYAARSWNRYGESLDGNADYNLIPVPLSEAEREKLLWVVV